MKAPVKLLTLTTVAVGLAVLEARQGGFSSYYSVTVNPKTGKIVSVNPLSGSGVR